MELSEAISCTMQPQCGSDHHWLKPTMTPLTHSQCDMAINNKVRPHKPMLNTWCDSTAWNLHTVRRQASTKKRHLPTPVFVTPNQKLCPDRDTIASAKMCSAGINGCPHVKHTVAIAVLSGAHQPASVSANPKKKGDTGRTQLRANTPLEKGIVTVPCTSRRARQ